MTASLLAMQLYAARRAIQARMWAGPAKASAPLPAEAHEPSQAQIQALAHAEAAFMKVIEEIKPKSALKILEAALPRSREECKEAARELAARLTESCPHCRNRIIQRVVAEYYDVRVADILSERRTADVVRPRQMAMYLAKILTSNSISETARRFNRDHTTMIHAARKIERLIRTDEAIAADVSALREMIEGGRSGTAHEAAE